MRVLTLIVLVRLARRELVSLNVWVPCRLPRWTKTLGVLAAIWKSLRALLWRHLTPG